MFAQGLFTYTTKNDMTVAMAAMLIMSVIAHPKALATLPFLCVPIIFSLLLMCTMHISITGATTPFAIAEYMRAFIGSIPMKFIIIPTMIEIIITP